MVCQTCSKEFRGRKGGGRIIRAKYEIVYTCRRERERDCACMGVKGRVIVSAATNER